MQNDDSGRTSVQHLPGFEEVLAVRARGQTDGSLPFPQPGIIEIDLLFEPDGRWLTDILIIECPLGADVNHRRPVVQVPEGELHSADALYFCNTDPVVIHFPFPRHKPCAPVIQQQAVGHPEEIRVGRPAALPCRTRGSDHRVAVVTGPGKTVGRIIIGKGLPDSLSLQRHHTHEDDAQHAGNAEPCAVFGYKAVYRWHHAYLSMRCSLNVGCAPAIARKMSRGTTSNSGPSLSRMFLTRLISVHCLTCISRK